MSLSVLCLVVALSDCVIVSGYSDGELLLIRFHNYVLFLSTFKNGNNYLNLKGSEETIVPEWLIRNKCSDNLLLDR